MSNYIELSAKLKSDRDPTIKDQIFDILEESYNQISDKKELWNKIYTCTMSFEFYSDKADDYVDIRLFLQVNYNQNQLQKFIKDIDEPELLRAHDYGGSGIVWLKNDNWATKNQSIDHTFKPFWDLHSYPEIPSNLL